MLPLRVPSKVTIEIALDDQELVRLRQYARFKRASIRRVVPAALGQMFSADAEFCAWAETQNLKEERRRQRQRVQHRATDIQWHLLPFLASQFTQFQDAMYMAEMPNSGSYWDCSARFDLAVFAEDLHGFEIKTETDHVRSRQIWGYEQLFDFVSLITVPGKIDTFTCEIPARWGIIQARADQSALHFGVIRHPMRNYPPAEALARLLCCPELLPVTRKIATDDCVLPTPSYEALQQTRGSILVAEMRGWERSILQRWSLIALKEHWKGKLLPLSEARRPEGRRLKNIDVSDLI